MTDHAHALLRLAQAATSELLDRLEAAEADALEQARLNGMGASLEAAETAWKVSDKSCYDLTEKVIPNLRDQLEAAEKDIALKEMVIDSLGAELNAVANECNTPYSFDPTDNGTICVRCLKEKMKALLQLIQQPLSKVRTLSPEQIERHKLTAGECPSGSEVLLVSSVRRLLGCGIGDEKP